MTKNEIRIQALLIRHKANGCIRALTKWENAFNSEAARVAIPAIQARLHQLEAEADGLDDLIRDWDEFGKFFEGTTHE